MARPRMMVANQLANSVCRAAEPRDLVIVPNVARSEGTDRRPCLQVTRPLAESPLWRLNASQAASSTARKNIGLFATKSRDGFQIFFGLSRTRTQVFS